MWKSNRFGWMIWVGMLAGLVMWNGACKSDTPKGAEAANVATDSGSADGEASRISAEAQKKMETGLERARKQEQEIARFNQQLGDLWEEVKKLPPAYKKNAKDFADLEARFKDFEQIAGSAKTNVTDLAGRLDRNLNPDSPANAEDKGKLTAVDQTTLDPNWEEQLAVIERTVSDCWAGYGKIEGIVEKLKNAKGGPVVLFD